MLQLNEEITEEFLETLTDSVLKRLESKLDQLDISLDFIAAALTGETAWELGAGQAAAGRHATVGRSDAHNARPVSNGARSDRK
jgi:hypothetical protein